MNEGQTQLHWLQHPALRGDAIAAFAALSVVFVLQNDSGSFAAAGVPVLCGIAGLLLRWTAMPIAFIVTLAYFLIFPIGIPFGMPVWLERTQNNLRVQDAVLALAMLTYLASQCRIFMMTPARGAGAPERPVEFVRPNEIAGYAYEFLTCVLLAFLIGWFLDHYELHFTDDAPLRAIPTGRERGPGARPISTQSYELSRFLLLTLGLVIVGGSLRLIFWYLRLRHLNANEARQMLLDVQWQENRRELARQELWRASVFNPPVVRDHGDLLFRWITRLIVLVMLGGFFVWLVYIYNWYI